jgi:enoyl-[acyl-carrier protein] reductase I
MFGIDLKGKNGLIFGVANHRSIAWAISKILDEAGMNLILAYQNSRLRDPVEKLSSTLQNASLVECDVSDDQGISTAFEQITNQVDNLSVVVHSIAFANREDLGGQFSHTGREGFQKALEISAYSLLPISRLSAALMGEKGGSIITLTFQASERVFPGYNIMGTAKAALENSVRQLAAEYGSSNIRVNAISAGPVDTLSSRVISNYRVMKTAHAERSPLGRGITQEEIANTALFLSSELSSGITGAIIPVDCGYNIMGV